MPGLACLVFRGEMLRRTIRNLIVGTRLEKMRKGIFFPF